MSKLRVFKFVLMAILTTKLTASSANDPTQLPSVPKQKDPITIGVTPIFSQILRLTPPSGFGPVYERPGPQSYIQKLVRFGETLDKWTQMMTITGTKDIALNPNISPKLFAEEIATDFRHDCLTSFNASGLSALNVTGYDGYVAAISCGAMANMAGQTSEEVMIIVIKGEHDYYTIQWAERGQKSDTPKVIDPVKWEEHFVKLTPIKLCALAPSPYRHCMGFKELE
ncbi:MAG TPA: hypothetical protein VFW00_06230 [Rhodocyclaceae bacterium]|nr:hypothetical protein [Rhodocyclaceae bacterium]